MTASLANLAIEIYLRQAYDDAVLRKKHALEFDPSLPFEAILSRFDREDATLRRYALRLGSQRYPHMKLVLTEAYYPDEYVFLVDRHDDFSFTRKGPDFDAWLALKSRNYRLKREIEDAWYAMGIPTMRQLRETKFTQSDVLRVFSGHTILLVDNDPDGGAIMQLILTNAGFGCQWAKSMSEAILYITDPTNAKLCGLALVDLLLTDGTGLQIVKAIRAQPETQDIPILLTSALSESELLLQDVDGYLRKPFSADELVARVKDLVRMRFDKRIQWIRNHRAPTSG